MSEPNSDDPVIEARAEQVVTYAGDVAVQLQHHNIRRVEHLPEDAHRELFARRVEIWGQAAVDAEEAIIALRGSGEDAVRSQYLREMTEETVIVIESETEANEIAQASVDRT